MSLVQIVFDPDKKKYRATPVDGYGWIRFPKHLRVEGAVYEVDELREGKSGSWIACGEIRQVTKTKVSRRLKAA